VTHKQTNKVKIKRNKQDSKDAKEKKWGCKAGSYYLTWSVVHCLVWAQVGRNATNARWVKAQSLVHVARVAGVPGGMTAERAWMTWHRQNGQMDKQAKKHKLKKPAPRWGKLKLNMVASRGVHTNRGQRDLSKQGSCMREWPHGTLQNTTWGRHSLPLHVCTFTEMKKSHTLKTNIRGVWELADYLNGDMSSCTERMSCGTG
jgi:hypothetical protein